MLQRILGFGFAISLVACGWNWPSDDSDPDRNKDTGNGDYPSGPYNQGNSYDPADPSVAGDAGANGDGDAGANGDGQVSVAAYPPIDATVGSADVAGCAAGAPSVGYLLSSTGVLSRFDPATFTATPLGTPACPSLPGISPWEMTASRSGTIYALYTDWSIYAIDPVSLSCTLTPWNSAQTDISSNFGLAIQRSNGVEALSMVAISSAALGGVPVLGRADLATMAFAVVGNMPPVEGGPDELQSDAYNRLFRIDGEDVMRVDPATAAILGIDKVPGFRPGANNTAMVVGQNVYDFAARDSDATIYRYDLVGKTTTAVVTLNQNVACATAVPCAQ